MSDHSGATTIPGRRPLFAVGLVAFARAPRRSLIWNGLLAPHRVGRTEAKPHDGTIITDKVNEMWGTDMTQTITIPGRPGQCLRRRGTRQSACGAEGFRINAVGPGACAARAGRLGRPERLNGVPPGEIAAHQGHPGGASAAIISRRTPPPKWPSTFSSDNVPPEHRKMRGRVRRSARDCGVAR